MFTLGRKIDLGYRPNLIIVIMTVFTAALGWIFTGSLTSGLAIGAGVFSTWALSRELDPKHEYSAFAAAAISLINLIYYDSIQFLVIAWLLLLLRLTNGISGKKMTIIDIALVLVLTVLSSFGEENSVYLIPFITAMFYFVLTRRRTPLALIAGGTGLVLFLGQTFFMNALTFNRFDFSDPLNLFTVTTLLLSSVVFWFISKDGCQDDKGNRVKRPRLLTTQLLFSFTILLLFFFGDISLTNLILYLSTLIGITLYFIVFKLFKKAEHKL